MIKIYNKDNLNYGYNHGYDNFEDAYIAYNPIPQDGLLLHVSLSKDTLVAETGQNLLKTGNITYQEIDEIPCAYFDGSSYLTLDNQTINMQEPLTLSVYARMTNAYSNQLYGFISCHINNDNSFILGTNGWYSPIRYATFGRNGGGSVSYALDLNICNVVFNKWEHIAAVYDGNNIIVYNNGVYVNKLENKKLSNVNGLITIGKGGMDNSYARYTYLSNVRIYNRILEEREIKSLYKEIKID